ncbi:MAG: polymer-forming cytoskeletal protein [Acidobacteriota bacterium]
MGNINSPYGTLVLTKRWRIEADFNVKVAVINGWVTGDITATERVVLESEAPVTGQIQTPALSMKLKALFDGECCSDPQSIHLGLTIRDLKSSLMSWQWLQASNRSGALAKLIEKPTGKRNCNNELHLHCKPRQRNACCLLYVPASGRMTNQSSRQG